MKRLLVTGASGLLGLNLAVEAAKDFDVYGVTHSNSIASSEFKLLSTDLCHPSAVQQIYDRAQPDWVIHCAALTNLDACEQEPDLAHEINAELPGRMAAEAAARGARFVHISTDAVFDGQKGNYSEVDEPNPLSVYARTKLAGERAVAEQDSNAIIARVNMFGWSPGGKRSLAEFFFNNLSQGKSVNGFTDVYFSPLLVNHLAGILLRMLSEGLSGLYHLFSSDTISKYQFGLSVAEHFGLDGGLISPIAVEESGLQAARSPNLSMDTGKLSAALGEQLPTIKIGLDGFRELFDQGYPSQLRAMTSDVTERLPQ